MKRGAYDFRCDILWLRCWVGNGWMGSRNVRSMRVWCVSAGNMRTIVIVCVLLCVCVTGALANVVDTSASMGAEYANSYISVVVHYNVAVDGNAYFYDVPATGSPVVQYSISGVSNSVIVRALADANGAAIIRCICADGITVAATDAMSPVLSPEEKDAQKIVSLFLGGLSGFAFSLAAQKLF